MMFFDRLASFVTGLGTAKDKSTSAAHVHVLRDRVELEAAYRDNWIARKAVDIVPFDMLRAWRGWQADETQVEAIEAAETALDLRSKYLAAMIRGRLYGGGAILIGTGDLDPTQELVIDRLPKGGLRYLHVLSRWELTAGEIQRDPMSPYYGEPTYYEVTAGNRTTQKIHPSRVVRFLGSPRPDGGLVHQDGWSDSILQAILDSVDQATSAAQHIAAMLPEAKLDIVFVPGLSNHLSTTEGTKALTERFAYANQIKSMFGMALFEGDGASPTGETYQQKQLKFDSLPDVARLFLQIASGAADIPVTRMLGQAPAGLNATGDSDTRNYYDHVAAKQQVELTPALRRLDRLVVRHALGVEPPGVWYAWNPLYQPSEKEKAEVGKLKAETISVLANAATVPEEVLAEGTKGWLIDSGLFTGIEAAYDTHKGPLVEETTPQDDLGPDGLPVPPSNIVPFRRQATADAAPRTLYVSRKVENAGEILAWAKSQGFTKTLDGADLHVTIAYSRQPVDWFAVGTAEDRVVVPRGGPRAIEIFGGGAVVLMFSDWSLRWRHDSLREAGASWDFPEYQPHLTITYDATGVDLNAVEPYQGKIVFGPEIFAEVDEDWQAKLPAAE
jgi:phage-related protein (TIGR01555 family)